MKILSIGLAVLALSAAGSTQNLVSVYDFNGSLNKVYDRDGHANALQFRQGRGATNSLVAGGPTYSTEMVGSTMKQVANFSDPVNQEQFFRAEHGMSPNGGTGAAFVNQYSIMFDLKITSSADWVSLYNTTANNTNDGDAFINPTNGLGISGDYAGTFARNQWNRVVLTASTPTGGPNEMNLYLNGAFANTITLNSGFEGRWALYAQNDPTTRIVDIFADENGDSGAGQVSQLAFYDKALSATEVASLGPVGTSAVPEPASMVALGAGVAALIRRRRK